jgi:hypothetical protein
MFQLEHDMTRPRRLILAACSAFALLVASVVLSSPTTAHADDFCAYEDTTLPTITGFGPDTVTLGITSKPVRFTVDATDECGIAGWSIDTPDRFLFFVYKQSPKDRVFPFRNRDAGPTAADIWVQDQAYNIATRRLTFQLLRDTRWRDAAAVPDRVDEGGRVRIRGTLQRADWEKDAYVRFGGSTERATVQFKARGTETWVSVKTVDFSDRIGRISTPVSVRGELARDGWYRLRFAGSATSSASVSTPEYVDVR